MRGGSRGTPPRGGSPRVRGVVLRRPSSAGDACTFPGHACPFPAFRVVDRVLSCARAAGQAGRPDFLRARPAAEPGRLPGRPTCGRCARVLWCAVVCCARPGACRIISHVATWPHAAACRFVSLWACWRLPAAVNGRGRRHVSTCTAGRPAQLGRRHDACTWSTRYPWKSSKYASWSTSWSVVMRSRPWTSSTSRGLPAQA